MKSCSRRRCTRICGFNGWTYSETLRTVNGGNSWSWYKESLLIVLVTQNLFLLTGGTRKITPHAHAHTHTHIHTHTVSVFLLLIKRSLRIILRCRYRFKDKMHIDLFFFLLRQIFVFKLSHLSPPAVTAGFLQRSDPEVMTPTGKGSNKAAERHLCPSTWKTQSERSVSSPVDSRFLLLYLEIYFSHCLSSSTACFFITRHESSGTFSIRTNVAVGCWDDVFESLSVMSWI